MSAKELTGEEGEGGGGLAFTWFCLHGCVQMQDKACSVPHASGSVPDWECKVLHAQHTFTASWKPCQSDCLPSGWHHTWLACVILMSEVLHTSYINSEGALQTRGRLATNLAV